MFSVFNYQIDRYGPWTRRSPRSDPPRSPPSFISNAARLRSQGLSGKALADGFVGKKLNTRADG
jgi:hypothetical protein